MHFRFALLARLLTDAPRTAHELSAESSVNYKSVCSMLREMKRFNLIYIVGWDEHESSATVMYPIYGWITDKSHRDVKRPTISIKEKSRRYRAAVKRRKLDSLLGASVAAAPHHDHLDA